MPFKTRRYLLLPIIPGPKVTVDGRTLLIHKWFSKPRRVPLDSLSAEPRYGSFSLRGLINRMTGCGDLAFVGSAVGNQGLVVSNVYNLKGLESAVAGDVTATELNTSTSLPTESEDFVIDVQSAPEGLLDVDGHNIDAVAIPDYGDVAITIAHELTSDRVITHYTINHFDMHKATKQTFVLRKGIKVESVLAHISHDTFAIIYRENGSQYLQAFSISAADRVGARVEMPKFLGRLGGFVSTLFGVENHYLWPCTIVPFNREHCVIVHDGQSSAMAHRLVCVDLKSGKLRCSPEMTWKIYDKSSQIPSGAENFGGGVENHAETTLQHRGSFITGSRLGWVREWSVNDLSLLNHWQLRIPEEYIPRERYHEEKNQWPHCTIRSLASSHDERLVAVGTQAGTIHLVRTSDWSEASPPLVPDSFFFGERSECPAGRDKPSHVASLSFHKDDDMLIAAYGNGAIRVWNVPEERQVGEDYTDGPLFHDKERIFVVDDRVLWYTGYKGKFESWSIGDILG